MAHGEGASDRAELALLDDGGDELAPLCTLDADPWRRFLSRCYLDPRRSVLRLRSRLAAHGRGCGQLDQVDACRAYRDLSRTHRDLSRAASARGLAAAAESTDDAVQRVAA